MKSAPLVSLGLYSDKWLETKVLWLVGNCMISFFFFGTIISPWKSRTFCYLDAFCLAHKREDGIYLYYKVTSKRWNRQAGGEWNNLWKRYTLNNIFTSPKTIRATVAVDLPWSATCSLSARNWFWSLIHFTSVCSPSRRSPDISESIVSSISHLAHCK